MKSKRLLAAFLLAVSIIVSVASLCSTQFSYAEDFPELRVHFLDVGQGDCCIIEFPDGKNMIIDAGDNKSYVKNKIKTYVDDNIKRVNEGKVVFDYAIMTHSDSDHIGSFEVVYNNYDVKTTYRPNQKAINKKDDTYADPASLSTGDSGFWGNKVGEKDTATYRNMLKLAYEKSENVVVTNPYSDTQNCIKYDGEDIYKKYEFNFYSPLSPYYSDNNNYSSIIVLSYQGKNIVLTGDAEKENEEEFVNAATQGIGRYAIFKDFGADVIKLGHHGSKTSTSEAYLNIVTKNSDRSKVFAIVSAGAGNKYNHPHQETLDRLKKFGFSEDRILYTEKPVKDENGNVVKDKDGNVEATKQDIVITVKNENGNYVLKYGDVAGGSASGNGSSSASSNSIVSMAVEWFNKQDSVTKITVVIAVILVVLLIIIVFASLSKRKRKKIVNAISGSSNKSGYSQKGNRSSKKSNGGKSSSKKRK